MAKTRSAGGGKVAAKVATKTAAKTSKKAARKPSRGSRLAPVTATSDAPAYIGRAGFCTWSPSAGYTPSTKKGEIAMFGDDGHRAVDLMLLSLGACLNFFLVEHAKSRNLPVTDIRVACTGEWANPPDRISKIVTRVVIDGDIDDKERRRMLQDCEKIWKVMNTIRGQPECKTLLLSPSGDEIA